MWSVYYLGFYQFT